MTIPPSVTNYIRGFLFENCYSLIAVSIPNTITIIGTGTFHNCYSLTSVNVPSGIKNFFLNCYSLDAITIDKPTNSITGSPWGATTGAFVYTQIIWHD